MLFESVLDDAPSFALFDWAALPVVPAFPDAPLVVAPVALVSPRVLSRACFRQLAFSAPASLSHAAIVLAAVDSDCELPDLPAALSGASAKATPDSARPTPPAMSRRLIMLDSFGI